MLDSIGAILELEDIPAKKIHEPQSESEDSKQNIEILQLELRPDKKIHEPQLESEESKQNIELEEV